ncbi:MAG: TonB-dependent receptor plug domain-containing protein [candidate division Zixibacteria bacterium]|nr:TonB-dependent receptor plug domain-containing protein [candidate division Zixibacteria bacterium]
MLFTFRHPRPGVFFILIFALIAILVVSPEAVYSLESHNIRGMVIDAESGRAIVNAKVRIAGRSIATNTDNHGYFILTDIPSGSYEIGSSADGYHPSTEIINISDGHDREITFRMMPLLYMLPEQKVTAQRIPSRIRSGSLIAEIEISPEQVHKSRDISDIIQELPGVFVRENGAGGERLVSINGCDPTRVEVIFDGVELNAGSGKAVNLNEIPASALRKVELYSNRGGIGGTIMLSSGRISDITESEFVFDESIASFGTQELSAEVGLRQNLVSLDLFADYSRSAGDFTYPDQLGQEQSRINNQRFSQNYFAKAKLPWEDSPEISFQYFHSEKGSPGPLLQVDSTASIENRKMLASVRYNRELSSSLSMELSSDGTLMRDNYSSTATYIKYDTEARERKWQSSLSIRNDKPFFMEAEAEYTYDDFQSENRRTGEYDISPVLRRSLKLSLLNGIERRLWESTVPTQISLQLGGKLHLNSRQKSFRTYNWDATVSASKFLSLSAAIYGGTTFRLPDYYSLFFKENIYALGNPELKPERGNLIGVRFRTFNDELIPITAGYAYTHNEIEDIIVWKQRFDGKYMPTNFEKAVLKTGSFDVSIGSKSDPIHIKFQHNRYHPINKSSLRLYQDKYLLFRPLYTADLNIDFGNDKIRFRLEHQWVGKRYIRMENTAYLDPYQLTSLSVNYKFNIKRLQFALRGGIENLNDEYYEIVERYPSPGRSYSFGINLSI